VKFLINCLLIALAVLALSACGGGGGGGKKSNRYPLASFTATPATGATPILVTVDGSASRDPDGSITGYAWDFGDCATGGGTTTTHTYTIAGTYTITLTVTDNKGARNTTTRQVTVTPGAPPATVAVSGLITYDRVPFHDCPLAGCPDGSFTTGGLDYANIQQRPARAVTVELVQACTRAVLATAATDGSGHYSLDAPVGTRAFVRAKARSVSAVTVAPGPTWDIEVQDNYGGANALYAIDGSPFDTGTAAQTRNLNAPSGWSLYAGYTSPRAAAPFAILDTLYSAVQFVVAQGDSLLTLAPLRVFWSEHNQPASPWRPDLGWIISTAYQPGTASPGIYVLGAADTDTDEFDQHVIAHEFQHFLEEQVSRSDSPGGQHFPDERLDLRVAFSEGFADAFSAMVLGDPLYRDSFESQQQWVLQFDIEKGVVPANALPGWYNEMSIMALAYDLYDGLNDDGVALGYAPLYQVMVNALRDGTPLTSIFPFVTALKQLPGAPVAAINARVQAEDIVASTMDAYATTETNSGMVAPEDPTLVLPMYSNVVSNGAPVRVCGDTVAGVENKIGNRRYLRFTVPTDRTIDISVSCLAGDATCNTGTPTPDPDIVLRRGRSVQYFDEYTTQGPDGSYTEQALAVPVTVGDYVLEVYDYSHVNPAAATRRGLTCMTVTITG